MFWIRGLVSIQIIFPIAEVIFSASSANFFSKYSLAWFRCPMLFNMEELEVLISLLSSGIIFFRTKFRLYLSDSLLLSFLKRTLLVLAYCSTSSLEIGNNGRTICGVFLIPQSPLIPLPLNKLIKKVSMESSAWCPVTM